ncbi:MAG: hypothetical protein LBI10_00760 [Deltaproteobacteria bacterium]|jgi:transcriptional regulator with XRE-family HTH domain|nr:hypothetical protein [Deltaproteobacteria bacterium]
MFNIDDIFRASLTYFSDIEKHQRRFATKIGVSAPYLNDLLKARRYGSDQRKREIAEKLGFADSSYQDFLDIGKKILTGENTNDYIISEELIKLADKNIFSVNYVTDLNLDSDNNIVIDENSDNIFIHLPHPDKYDVNKLLAFKYNLFGKNVIIRHNTTLVIDQSATYTANNDNDIFLIYIIGEPGSFTVSNINYNSENNAFIFKQYNNKHYNNKTIYLVKKSDEFIILGKVIYYYTFFGK